MKIFNGLLLLTCVVLLNFTGINTSRNNATRLQFGNPNVHRPDENPNIRIIQVQSKRFRVTTNAHGNLVDVQLLPNNFRPPPGTREVKEPVYINDHGLKFFVHRNEEGAWIGASPLSRRDPLYSSSAFIQTRQINVQGHYFKVKTNARGNLVDVKLLPNNFRPPPGTREIKEPIFVNDHGLAFIVHRNEQGAWIGASPLSERHQG